MRIKKKNKKIMLTLFILILGIGIGYAALSKTLKINGTSGIKKGSWIIYFDNIRNESGVVSTDTKISTDKKEVSFNIEITEPGDYYEFEVDTVNDGTIDAMIDSTEFTGIDSADKDKLSFDVVYEDGTEVKKCDILQAGTRKKIKVKFEYSDEIDKTELLDEKTLDLVFKINYVQNTTCENKVVLNIDPNGGKYQNLTSITKISLDKNSTYDTIGIPTREGYIFKYWETEDGTRLEQDNITNNYIVSVGIKDLTVRAVWEIDTTDYVARINTTYYETIQDAIDAAVANDEIHMLKNTTESPTNNKKVVLNLEDFTVTGTLTNTPEGDIVLKNGKLTSESTTVVNNGTFTLGVKDGDYQIDDIIIEGETKGLEQNKNFYFYDGHIIALQGIDGGCNGKEDGYYIYVDNIKRNNADYQKVYLIDHPDGVAMTINGEEFYFFSLQYAVADTDNLHPTVYIIKDFESSADVTVAENQKLVLDMNGHTLTYGAQLTNNGDLEITDSSSTKGSFEISLPIKNSNNLTIDDVVINQTTNANLIQNDKNINITKSSLKAKSGNVIYNTNAGTINLDEDSVFTSSGYVFNNNADGETTLKGGKVNSINNAKGTLILENITMNSTRNPSINQSGGTLNIKSGTYQTTGSTMINVTGGNVVFDGGTFIQNSNGNYNYILYGNSCTTTINGGNFTQNNPINGIVIRSKNVTMNAGEITSLSGGAGIDGNGDITINDGTINTKGHSVIGYNKTINGGYIHSIDGSAIYSNNNTIIKDGTIKSDNSYAVYVGNNTTTIEGGTIVSDKSTAVFAEKGIWWYSTNVVVNGGNIKGKIYGIQTKDGAPLRIGKNAATLDTTNPEIIGETYGIYTTGEVSFYDGILKGKTRGFSSAINTKRAKHLIKEDTEEINGETYNTAYLEEQPIFVKTDDGEEFNSLQDAVNHIASLKSAGTITVTREATYSDNTTIPNGKSITIDTDGKTLNLTKSIINNGTLTLKDSLGTGHLKSSATYLVDYNNSYRDTTLNIESGNYQGWSIVRKNSGGILNITGGNFSGGELINTSSCTITISDATFTSSTSALNLYGTITLNNVTITNTATSGNGTVQIGSDSTATLTNCNITSNTTAAIVNSGNTTINGGTYKANNSTIVTNGGTTRINDGTITSKNSNAIYNRKTTIIEGGTITSETTSAILNVAARYDYPNLVVTGGKIIGATSGITSSGTSDNMNNTVTIGTNNSEIKNTPIIQGSTYGVDIASGMTFNFYDGILKGKTRGYNGTINSFPGKTVISEGTEIIDDVTYNTAYIEGLQNFVDTNDGESFNSLQDAFNHIANELNGTGTATLTASVSTSDSATLPEGTTAVLNLNGYQYTSTKTITNKGELTVTDNSTEGSMTNNKGNIFNNTGTLTINKGTFTTSNNISYLSSGTVNINGGTLKSSSSAFQNDGGTLNINGGTITNNNGNTYYQFIYLNDGTLNISGGTINGGSIGAVKAKKGSLNITGGEIITNSSNDSVEVESSVIATIENVTIRNTGYGGCINNSGNTTIKGDSLITAGTQSDYAICNYGTLRYENGTVNSGKYGLQLNGGTATIVGGAINGNTYGVYTNGGTLNIGENEGSINTTTPIIKGNTYGLYINSGTVNFYDGILKGQTAGYTGIINQIATDSQITSSSETIDEVTYNTTYLVESSEYIQNETTGTKYKNINNALSKAEENDTLTFIDNGVSYDAINIPDKNLTIDFNTYSLTANKAITNSGVTNLVDNSENKGGKIVTSAAISLITNNNELNVSNLNIRNSNTSTKDLISNSNGKTLTINSSTLYGYTVVNNVGSGTVTISNSSIGTVYGGYGCKNNASSGTLIINNGNFSTYNYAIYNYDGNVSVEGGNYSSASASLYLNKSSNADLKDIHVKNATMGNGSGALENNGANLYLENTNTKGSVKSTILLDIKGGTLDSSITNEKTINIEDATINGCLINKGPGNIKNTSITLSVYSYSNSDVYDRPIIDNTSTLEITDTTLKSISTSYYKSNFQGIKNSGTLTFNSGTMNIEKGVTNYGIYNTGTTNFYNGSINVKEATTGYGVYNTGTFTMLGGEAIVTGVTNATGFYQNGGEMIFGHLEGTGIDANPSTTNPLIKGIGTTSGYGVRKINGIFRFFDGKFVGSTEAKPEAPTQIEEPDYEVVFGTDTDGYNYSTLKYLEQH